MARKTPYMTANDLIAAVKRKAFIPTSQNALNTDDILSFLNEEMIISQVPSVLQYHEEFFVHMEQVTLVASQSRYPIPNRAIGMKLRDLFYEDSTGNIFEMTRVTSEDKAMYQQSYSVGQSPVKYYIEGNDIVLVPSLSSSPSGYLNFYIYLRPNQLVPDERACICTYFSKKITAASVVAGDTFTINDVVFTAVASGAGDDEFDVGGTDTITATNMVTAINANAACGTASSALGVVTVLYTERSWEFESSTAVRLAVQSTLGVKFDQVPTTYLDTDTGLTETLYAVGELVDFLQTKAGHSIRGYDVEIPTGGIVGTTINFVAADVPTTFIVGDYICLSNECIIPQLPPDLHGGLAERACARILAAIGDQAGSQASMLKIQEIDSRQGSLIDSRVDGSPLKITGRRSILRSFK